jgi:dinuclear metal center YbgI/SA1388 family protein
MLRVKDVTLLLERWAPRDLAWENDNTGLQVGSPAAAVRRILVGLDPTEGLVHEAERKRADLIITHHPLLFTPLRTLDTSTPRGRLLAALLRSGRTLYSAHTNLDFAPGGTSFALADRLGLQNVRFLSQHSRTYRKVVTFVPEAAVDRVAEAMTAVGGGTIGNYDSCSFRLRGTGTFRGNSRSSPRVGKRGRIERVEEVRLEMLVDERSLPAVLEAMRRAHPYEEVAYDVYPLENIHPGTGMGAIGTLPARCFLHSSVMRKRLTQVRCVTRASRRAHPHRRRVRGAGRTLLQVPLRPAPTPSSQRICGITTIMMRPEPSP